MKALCIKIYDLFMLGPVIFDELQITCILDVSVLLCVQWWAECVCVFQGCPTMQRLAAANGLVASVGSESYIIQVRNVYVISHKCVCSEFCPKVVPIIYISHWELSRLSLN